MLPAHRDRSKGAAFKALFAFCVASACMASYKPFRVAKQKENILPKALTKTSPGLSAGSIFQNCHTWDVRCRLAKDLQHKVMSKR